MIALEPDILEAFRRQAAQAAPQEACALVVIEDGRQSLRPCPNRADDPVRDFRIDGNTLAEAEDQGLLAILHSHPARDASPSMADRVSCERTAVPWVILGAQGDLFTLEPSGYVAPLIGRPYTWGVLDCWGLVRDYYAQELGLDLPDFDRVDQFWKLGLDLFATHAADAGFVPVDEPRPHDLIAMAIRSEIANHLAIYLGDQRMLHHRTNRPSTRELYGGLWLMATTRIYRHRSML